MLRKFITVLLGGGALVLLAFAALLAAWTSVLAWSIDSRAFIAVPIACFAIIAASLAGCARSRNGVLQGVLAVVAGGSFMALVALWLAVASVAMHP